MILKYKHNDVWGYIDNIRQVGNKLIDCQELIKEYNECKGYKDEHYSGENDIASYMNGEKLSEDIANVNKVFLMAINSLSDVLKEYNAHQENLLVAEKVKENYAAYVILLYLNDHKEYDTLILVCNDPVYLLNDKGQTIERLV